MANTSNFVPMINGINDYDWANIKVEIMTRTIMGISNITYSTTQVKDNNYGAGVNVVSRGYGNKEHTGSITLSMFELEALQDIALDGDITNIGVFDIVVMYESKLGSIKTHILYNCEFMNNERAASQGDTLIETTCDLIISHINWNA